MSVWVVGYCTESDEGHTWDECTALAAASTLEKAKEEALRDLGQLAAKCVEPTVDARINWHEEDAEITGYIRGFPQLLHKSKRRRGEYWAGLVWPGRDYRLWKVPFASEEA